MTTRRRRLLVLVDPPMLGEVLGRVLEADGVDEVVALPPGAVIEGPFDGALVTIDLPDGVADVVIRLPDFGSNAGSVSTNGHEESIDIRDVADVIDLLDEHVAGNSSRSDGLRRRGL